jgi:xylulokinase
VSAGGGDNMMGAIGTGNVVPGAVTASFGTSGTIYAYSSKPVVDPTGEIAAFCSSTGGWMPLLCTMNVTGVTEQVRALFGWELSDLESAASAAPAGAGGLTLLPYFDGERTPNLPKGTGTFFGLNRTTLQKGHMARAAMEGATLGMNYGLQRLAKLGVKAKEIRMTGGGARSALWRQVSADIFGVPVVAMAQDESAALGGALQAAWCDSPGRGSAKALAGTLREERLPGREDALRPGQEARGTLQSAAEVVRRPDARFEERLRGALRNPAEPPDVRPLHAPQDRRRAERDLAGAGGSPRHA